MALLDHKRTAESLTWKQVADRLDVSASTLSRLATGKAPGRARVRVAARGLDLDTDIAYMTRPGDQA